MIRARTLTSLAVLAALAAGCGSVTDRIAEEAAEQAVEEAAGGEVDIDEDGGNITIESSEGSMSMGAGGDLPDAFPEDVPLPEGDYEVVSSFEQSGSDGIELQAAVQTQAAVEELQAFYAEQLPANGWEIADERSQSMDGLESVTFSIKHEDGERSGIVTVTKAGDDPTLVNFGFGTQSS